MREYGLLTTLVVIMCVRYLIADVTLQTTTFDELKFWQGDPKYDKNASRSLRKSPKHDPMGALLERFFHSPGNQSVFRYSEMQQLLKTMDMGKKGHDTRRFIDDLPNLIETADLLLNQQDAPTTVKTIPKNKSLSDITVTLKFNVANTRRRPTTRPTKYKQYGNVRTRIIFHYRRRNNSKETTPNYEQRTNARRMSVNYNHRHHINDYARRTTYTHKHHSKPSRKKFEPLKYWVRDPRFEKKWPPLAQNRGAKARARGDISENYFNYLKRYSLRDSSEIESSYNTPRSFKVKLRSASRELRKIHSRKQPKFKCRPSAEIQDCYNDYLAINRRVPKMMRAVAESQETNLTLPIQDVSLMPMVRAGGFTDAAVAETNQEETQKEKKVPEDLNPYSILQQIEEKLKPVLIKMDANITFEVLGRTLEYKDIVMIKATAMPKKMFRAAEDKYDNSVPDKKIVLIVHGLAAMGIKYLPCLSTVDGLAKLMSYYYEHLDKFDIFVIPMANPDGAASWVQWTNTYWNKNMSPQSACPGVALDRNFDVAWKESQSTVSSCRQQYPGTEPFSEPETQALREVFHKYGQRIIGYFHVHASSYTTDVFKGDAVLYPKGYTDLANDDDRYVDLKGEIDDMMKNASFKVYSFSMDTLYNWYGKVCGTSVDYAASVYGVPFSMELVMQLYTDDMLVEESEEREQAIVLTEVWHKVIDVIFKFIYKSQKSTES